MFEIDARIEGKVQGVFFRDFLQAKATELGIVGFAENAPDGTVHVCAQGREDLLQEFVSYMHQGSPLSKVREVKVQWRECTEIYDTFSIRY